MALFPSFLSFVLRALRFLDERNQPITWFIVGETPRWPRTALCSPRSPGAGHEIGNHSYLHEPWLHRYSPERLDEELCRAGRAIEDATGTSAGFRGPGFSVSKDVLLALERRGYRYDALTLPTFIGPWRGLAYRTPT